MKSSIHDKLYILFVSSTNSQYTTAENTLMPPYLICRQEDNIPDSKVRVANMGPTWVRHMVPQIL